MNRFEEANADVHIYFALDADKLTFMSVEEGIRCYNSNNNNSNMRIVFGFFDPNSQSTYPGWPLRNYLALLALKWSVHISLSYCAFCFAVCSLYN